MHTPSDSLLGRETAYPDHYDAALLFPIPRAQARSEIGIAAPLPFIGHDRWHAYELSWLDAKGKPRIATATFTVPADSPNLIESKSFKLYLNSFNAHRCEDEQALRTLIEADLSRAAGAPVTMAFGLTPIAAEDAVFFDLDTLDITVDHYGPADASLLQTDATQVVEQRFTTALLKSNCPVTGQPDWADVAIHARGPRIAAESLLRYIVSFRNHGEFHEQCVERIFADLMAHAGQEALSVQARYTRRGGLDINPWRATRDMPVPVARRTERQ